MTTALNTIPTSDPQAHEGAPNADPSSAAAAPPARFLDAIDAVRDDLARMDPSTLIPVNRDVTAAALVALGAAPEVRRLRAAMVEQFGEEKAARVDRLELIARAAASAQAEHVAFSGGEDLVPLSNAVVEVRAALISEAQSLIARKHLGRGSLENLDGTNGYRNQIADTLRLVSLFQGSWASIAGVTGLALADLHRAEGLANALATAVGLRDRGTASPSADVRQRAYTLLVRTYDGVRRMITYLRWEEGDADRIAPSLYAGRKRRRRPGEATEGGKSEVPTGPSDVPAPGAAGLLGGNPFTDA